MFSSKQEEIKFICNFIIILAILFIVTSIAIIFAEIHSAKKGCEELEGEYKFYLPFNHTCNNSTIYNYPNGWSYPFPTNISFTNP